MQIQLRKVLIRNRDPLDGWINPGHVITAMREPVGEAAVSAAKIEYARMGGVASQDVLERRQEISMGARRPSAGPTVSGSIGSHSLSIATGKAVLQAC